MRNREDSVFITIGSILISVSTFYVLGYWDILLTAGLMLYAFGLKS